MERVDQIIRNELFQSNLALNCAAEADRRFCRHNIDHLLAVCRLAWIICLEEKRELPKELVYAAGLLHDIGKHRQYREGIPHEIASAEIAENILTDCEFTIEEREAILSAIRSHREEKVASQNTLNGILYRADKASRNCYACPAEADCNWKGEKKNFHVY